MRCADEGGLGGVEIKSATLLISSTGIGTLGAIRFSYYWIPRFMTSDPILDLHDDGGDLMN